MASAADWLEGARPRTLFMAVAPVIAGTGVAAAEGGWRPVRVLLALVVSLALQIGVNYANDYSDGLRGTDAARVGPVRLVGSGLARPAAVRAAALTCFAIAGVAGLILAALAGWWLIAVGVIAVIAAWTYTGGPRPYGYLGLGEVSVFVFFGLVAVIGTAYGQTGRLTLLAAVVGSAIGLLACALLVVNNLRDIDGDRVVGKRTLAVRIGDRSTRWLYVALVAVPFGLVAVAAGLVGSAWPLLGWLALPLAVPTVRPVRRGALGRDLIPSLRHTGQLTVLLSALLAIGLAVS